MIKEANIFFVLKWIIISCLFPFNLKNVILNLKKLNCSWVVKNTIPRNISRFFKRIVKTKNNGHSTFL